MAAKTTIVSLPEIRLQDTVIYVRGTTPLIAHAFPEKARKAMLDKQMKKASGGRQARDPVEEYEAARYRLPDGRDGFPSVAFKACAVTACTSLADMTKVAARQAFQVFGEPMETPGLLDGSVIRTQLVPLVAPTPRMREDIVRLSGPGRTPEVRYRPEYSPWGVRLHVRFNTAVLSIEQLMTLFSVGGMGVGVGDYRSERDGDAGMFDVVSEADFLKLEKEVT